MGNTRRYNKKMLRDNGWIIQCSIYGLIAGAMLLFWVVSSAMEAKAYNKVTGEDVSMWDAMFIELRVTSSPKGE